MPRRKDKSVDELKILKAADDADYGVKVYSSDISRLRNRLYACLRKNRGDFTNDLTLTPDPDDSNILCVVHKRKYDE